MYDFFVSLLEPFRVFYLAMLVGLIVLWCRAEKKRRLWWITVPFIGFTLVTTPAISYFAIGSLEWQYPPGDVQVSGDQAIVLLSGWAFRPDEMRSETVLGIDSQFRALQAAKLYRQSQGCAILVSGGKVKPEDVGPTLAALIRDELIDLHVKTDDIVVEESSRDTFENAVESARLLKARGIERIVLVTAATHLPRAVACFRAQGLEVTPAGCDYQALEFGWSLFTFLPSPEGAAGFQRASHEWLGLLVYWVRGRF